MQQGTIRATMTGCVVVLVGLGYLGFRELLATGSPGSQITISIGMKEKAAEKLLFRTGFKPGIKLGCSHGWASSFEHSNGLTLSLDIAPKMARPDGALVNGLVRAIKSNGVEVTNIKFSDTPHGTNELLGQVVK